MPPKLKQIPRLLLVGSTGAGKSTLGNFLYDPDPDHIFAEKPTFLPGGGALPCTRELQLASGQEVIVIDSPGLNDSEGTEDFYRMVKLVEQLASIGEVHGILYVVKSFQKLDRQWQETAKFFQRLFGIRAFRESNLAIVLTNFSRSKASERQRRREQKRPEEFIAEVSNELQRVLGLSRPPTVFMVDSLPGEEDRRCQIETRRELLEYFQGRNKFSLRSDLFDVAKTQDVLHSDQLQAARLEGELELEARLLRVDLARLDPEGFSSPTQPEDGEFTPASCLALAARETEKIDQGRRAVMEKQRKLAALDSDEEVKIAEWFLDEDYNALSGKRTFRSFALQFSTPTSRTHMWKRSGLEFVDVKRDSGMLTGVVQKTSYAPWMRLQAEVVVYALKKDRYAQEISRLKEEISQREGAISQSQHELDRLDQWAESNSPAQEGAGATARAAGPSSDAVALPVSTAGQPQRLTPLSLLERKKALLSKRREIDRLRCDRLPLDEANERIACSAPTISKL